MTRGICHQKDLLGGKGTLRFLMVVTSIVQVKDGMKLDLLYILLDVQIPSDQSPIAMINVNTGVLRIRLPTLMGGQGNLETPLILEHFALNTMILEALLIIVWGMPQVYLRRRKADRTYLSVLARGRTRSIRR